MKAIIDVGTIAQWVCSWQIAHNAQLAGTRSLCKLCVSTNMGTTEVYFTQEAGVNFFGKSQLLAGGLSTEHGGNQLLVRDRARGRVCRMQWLNHTKQCKLDIGHGNFQNLKFQSDLTKILRIF